MTVDDKLIAKLQNFKFSDDSKEKKKLKSELRDV